MFKDKVLLVTGGTGSFGNALVKKFLSSEIKEIRIFSRDEKKQDKMRKEFNNKKLLFYLGDIRDSNSIRNVIDGVDYVFHAAALKQVPSCEFFPLEAVKTNIIGTHNLIVEARNTSVKKIVTLSTDKAVYPINAMGISKAMMEKIMIAESVGKNNSELTDTNVNHNTAEPQKNNNQTVESIKLLDGDKEGISLKEQDMPVLEKVFETESLQNISEVYQEPQHSQSQNIESGNSSYIIDNKRNKDIHENSKSIPIQTVKPSNLKVNDNSHKPNESLSNKNDEAIGTNNERSNIKKINASKSQVISVAPNQTTNLTEVQILIYDRSLVLTNIIQYLTEQRQCKILHKELRNHLSSMKISPSKMVMD